MQPRATYPICRGVVGNGDRRDRGRASRRDNTRRGGPQATTGRDPGTFRSCVSGLSSASSAAVFPACSPPRCCRPRWWWSTRASSRSPSPASGSGARTSRSGATWPMAATSPKGTSFGPRAVHPSSSRRIPAGRRSASRSSASSPAGGWRAPPASTAADSGRVVRSVRTGTRDASSGCRTWCWRRTTA